MNVLGNKSRTFYRRGFSSYIGTLVVALATAFVLPHSVHAEQNTFRDVILAGDTTTQTVQTGVIVLVKNGGDLGRVNFKVAYSASYSYDICISRYFNEDASLDQQVCKQASFDTDIDQYTVDFTGTKIQGGMTYLFGFTGINHGSHPYEMYWNDLSSDLSTPDLHFETSYLAGGTFISGQIYGLTFVDIKTPDPNNPNEMIKDYWNFTTQFQLLGFSLLFFTGLLYTVIYVIRR